MAYLPRTVSAREFGAKGDGSNDDTVPLQAALTALYSAGGGILLVPAGTYKVTAQLNVYQNVGIVGEGSNSYLTETFKGTQFYFAPTSANTDFMVVARNAAGENPSNYCDAILRDFSVYAVNANARDGIYFQNGRVDVSNVYVRGFSAKGVRLRGMINSLFAKVTVNDCDIGVYMDADGTVSTTVQFDSCYLTDHRVCAQVQNTNGVVFVASIFESATEQGILADAARLSLVHPYFEDIGQEFIKAGATTEVLTLDVLGGTYTDGALNDTTYAGFSLDRVAWARIMPQAMEVSKRTLVQTTSNAGTLHYSQPQHIIPDTGTARSNGAVVAKGADISVVCDDSVTRIFRVVTAGTLAGSQPAGYSRYTVGKTDGTAVLSRLAAEVIYDETKVVTIGYQAARGRINGMLSTEKNGNRYNFAAEYNYENGDLTLGRQGATFTALYSRPSDDKIGLRSNSTDQVSSTHGTMIGDGVQIINRVGDNRECAMLTQRVDDRGFLNFNTSSAADLSKPVTTRTTPGAVAGFVRVNTPMGMKWMAVYDDPT